MCIPTVKCSPPIITRLLKNKYDHFAGNYGNAWWKQLDEFVSFHGPILFTTNCIVPPRSEEVRSRIFTTGSAGYPGCRHIEADEIGKKDFLEIIALARTLSAPDEIESGSIVGGFAHNQVMALADRVVEAVKGFLSPNVAKVLAEQFGLAGIGTVDSDIELFMAQ
jgi:hydroxylamine reductase (hybrid-cluster protein)